MAAAWSTGEADPDDFPGQTLATRSKSWPFTKPWIGWHRSRPARLSWSNSATFSVARWPRRPQILGIAQATAEEDWTYAKAWLRRQWLRDEEKNSPG